MVCFLRIHSDVKVNDEVNERVHNNIKEIIAYNKSLIF